MSEKANFLSFQIYELNNDIEPNLIDYLWENSLQLPFLKDMPLLRQFKTDYFAILIAGKTVNFN